MKMKEDQVLANSNGRWSDEDLNGAIEEHSSTFGSGAID